MFRIRKEFKFEAAHDLPNHDGKCRNLHGHSYRYEVFLVGEVPVRATDHPKEGMLVDFSDVSAVAKKIHALIDHTYLNDSAKMHLHVGIPTAENMARGLFTYFHINLDARMPSHSKVEKVRVWETATAYAEYIG